MADRSERLRHLFPEAVTSTRRYTTPKAKRDPNAPPAYPQRADPAAHARSLLEQLAAVARDGPTLEAERIAEQLQDCSGVVVDVLVIPNDDISLQSLADERAGIELLTVTELSPQLVQATLFVPDGKLVALERKIQAFAPSDPTKKPWNVALVSSLESIRRAVAQSFWSDSSTEFPSGAEPYWWEVWLRRGVEPARFRRHAEILKMHVGERELRFPYCPGLMSTMSTAIQSPERRSCARGDTETKRATLCRRCCTRIFVVSTLMLTWATGRSRRPCWTTLWGTTKSALA